MTHEQQQFDPKPLDEYLTRSEKVHLQDRNSMRSAANSVIITVLTFMSALLLVRYVMPRLVEEVHYGIERGKQRAKFEIADEKLADDPTFRLSQSSQLVSQKIAPSVVHIDTVRYKTPEDSPALPDSFERMGQGSGIIFKESGEILTNYHVVHDAEQITVTFSDDRKLNADVIALDKDEDLAVLKVDAKGLTAATWGDSKSLREGEFVWAVGSPFGLNKSITFGILSATQRQSSGNGRVQEYLQSDAAVHPGNSGGPLVNNQGQVVGINTAILGPSFQGVSFAIPSSRAQLSYERIRNNQLGWLGVKLGGPDTIQGFAADSGALIAGIIDRHGSPAEQAGIKTGDIITRWDGRSVDSPSTLIGLVSKSKVDSQVEVELLRNGSTRKLKVDVGAKPLQLNLRR